MSQELDYLSRYVVAGRLTRREFLGRATALGVSATFASSLLAGAARAQGPVRGGFLRSGLGSGAATDSLDPAAIGSNVPIVFSKCWGELLLEMTPDGGIEYRIAEEIDSSKDAKTWTMKIRKGVQFHNGKEVTAQDVVATLERHSDEKSKSGALGILKSIESFKVDGGDVVITLKESNADLPYLMTDYHLIIQPNGGKDDPAAGISAGPYKVTVNEPGVRHGGEKFKNYWQGDKYGHADQVEIIVINDPTARMAALQGNQVNMIGQVPPRIVDLVKQVPGVTIQNVSGRGYCSFNIFCDTAPFDNNDLRMALKLAMDREEMVDKILRGYGTIGNDFPINASYQLFPEDIEQRAFDPDKAKFHYQKSGHRGPILLRTSEAGFTGAVDAAQLYAQSCAKAGITIKVKREPVEGYDSEVWNKQPFLTNFWNGRPTQDQIYSTVYLSTAPWNDTHFRNEKFDKLLIEARAEFDQDKRKDLYREIAIILRDEGGVIVPMFNQSIDATGPGVKGFVKDPVFSSMAKALEQCWLEA
ncbi:ABC transporter substrate-binding protein [Mesorhizobium loti]|uniref:Probable ABC transporter n=2 Tax=Rhizobium loti TaxID=381 RepID=M5ALT9_RHILI|nr:MULTISPECIES: ABC transporter substrate-binding protein [Mesorhizobium]ANN60832.1 peptide ABC transporter substrate-binding protein [Mesorhizobium loti NZP2037]OBQ66478.1 peptide ABC transporter substrate-binding protein [Mesorhizobium loti]QKC66418.1 ABC transporter substrate-binding protein [Mesorhizobium jarvisii]QKD12331.1 ABC transporter substrate-binding protein [Mesorhizobium loti]BAN09798.1 probable ABC transporter [Mesorhizobium loti NZP2037]